MEKEWNRKSFQILTDFFLLLFLLFSAIFINYGRKIFLSNGTFFYPMFANCVHLTRCSFTFLNFDFFSPNWNTFAVKCDSKSKISQNKRNLGFLKKIDGFFFEKKTLKFFKIAKCCKFCRMFIERYYFPKMFFHLNCEVFLAKNQKIFKLERIKIWWRSRKFREKRRSSIKKASLPKWEDRKYAGGSRASF